MNNREVAQPQIPGEEAAEDTVLGVEDGEVLMHNRLDLASPAVNTASSKLRRLDSLTWAFLDFHDRTECVKLANGLKIPLPT